MTRVKGDLTIRCHGCGEDVSGSKKAVVHVSYRDIHRATEYNEREIQRRLEEKDRGEHRFEALTLAELLDKEEDPRHEARWAVHCDGCNPHWNEDHTEACGNCYWWSLDRCKTAEELLHWTAHLHQTKGWLQYTDWEKLLYGIPEIAGVRT